MHTPGVGAPIGAWSDHSTARRIRFRYYGTWRPDRATMGTARPLAATAAQREAGPPVWGPSQGNQWHSLGPAHRRAVAGSARAVWPLPNVLRSLRALAALWPLGTPASDTPGRSRCRGGARVGRRLGGRHGGARPSARGGGAAHSRQSRGDGRSEKRGTAKQVPTKLWDAVAAASRPSCTSRSTGEAARWRSC